MRPSWDMTWMSVAHVVARRSLCSRAKTGAVIVDARNRIVATGYNGPPAGYVTSSVYDVNVPVECNQWCTRGRLGPTPDTLTSYEDCPMLHAELNALSVCDRSMREKGTLYVTGAICFSCAKAVGNSGLQRVVVDTSVRYDYRNPSRSMQFLSDCGLIIIDGDVG